MTEILNFLFGRRISEYPVHTIGIFSVLLTLKQCSFKKFCFGEDLVFNLLF